MNVLGTIFPACNGIVKWFDPPDRSRFSRNLFLPHKVGMYRRANQNNEDHTGDIHRYRTKISFGIYSRQTIDQIFLKL